LLQNAARRTSPFARRRDTAAKAILMPSGLVNTSVTMDSRLRARNGPSSEGLHIADGCSTLVGCLVAPVIENDGNF
jgi:hypothetical protein